MAVINAVGRPVKTSTRRWHHLDTDLLANQQPVLYRDLECGIVGSIAALIAGVGVEINSSVEGKKLLAAFTGTPALHQYCDAVNAQRTARLIEPRHLYGVTLLRVLGGHPDTGYMADYHDPAKRDELRDPHLPAGLDRATCGDGHRATAKGRPALKVKCGATWRAYGIGSESANDSRFVGLGNALLRDRDAALSCRGLGSFKPAIALELLWTLSETSSSGC